MRAIFLLPVLFGALLIGGSLALFRRNRLDPRYFAVAILLSILVMASPIVYGVLRNVGNLLGFVYTFVLGFGLAILVLISLVIYLILAIGAVRDETETMWQEIALVRTELEQKNTDTSTNNGPDDY